MSEYTKQAEQFAAKHGVKLKVLASLWGRHFPEDKVARHIFKMKISRRGKSYTFEFGQSIANGAEEPDMYSVLACLTKSDPEDFEWFCKNYGYDTDSRTAERTYKAVCKEWAAVERLFGDVLDELQEIN